MARPSKTQHFTIYQDASIPSPDPSHDHSTTQHDDVSDDDIEDDGADTVGGGRALEGIDEDIEPSNIDPTDTEREDGRRESAVTSASISSLPESSSETDQDHATPIHTAYSPRMIRPSFRRPDSVRRLQMSSPSASFERSPRRSVLHTGSRAGTPRSNRGSPTMKKRYEELLETEEEKKAYPLVLLHVTLLPVRLRWSMKSVQELLPDSLLEDYRLLRSKVSETMAQRGILILHPKDDYELLEERLLEALDLKAERITKCGHFRAQGSISSISSSEESTDSAIGSSIASSSADICGTCHRQVKGADSGHGQRWNIEVYAANGFMRASAWSAAWSEMERVDVEILPWISDDLRRTLDARLQDEEDEERQRAEDGEKCKEHVRELVEQQVPIEQNSRTLAEEGVKQGHVEDLEETTFETEPRPLDDLPPIYPRKDIPLSVLLKNYLYLLAQDKRNIAIFGFAVLALWMSIRTALIPTVAEGPMAPAVYEPGHQRSLTSDGPACEISSSSSFVAEPTSTTPAFESTELAATVSAKMVEHLEEVAHEVLGVEEEPIKLEPIEANDIVQMEPAPLTQKTYENDEHGKCENPASIVSLFGCEERS